MKLNALFLTTIFATASAFAPAPTFVRRTALFSDVEESVAEPVAPPAPSAPTGGSGGALVPIKEESIQFTAGVIGGLVGFSVAGPVGGAIGAGFANFASKTDEDVGDVVQNLSKTTLEVYNYFVKLDNKYALLNKAQSALQKSYDQLKESGGDPEALEKVEKALADTTGKINEVNEEYDVVGAGLQALGIVGDVTEKAVKKTIELNAEYKLTDKALDAIQKAIEKVKASA
ncbi:hypothetical protein TrVE_jg10363 [Triparma verrucosa]|uniref:Uncharacterized protein n=2 Tax=Triparma TaxID=722752 RepID=A0A9W7BPZ8_9STRA|nr:hypothetical protein TrST_g2701 [Triparma strigata]GMI12411.1 hypothetical protein TrVE_jg10363 [Triparma verrucosa]